MTHELNALLLYYSDMLRPIYYISIAVATFLVVVLLWILSAEEPMQDVAKKPIATHADSYGSVPTLDLEDMSKARMQLFQEDPDLLDAVKHGAGFGGSYSFHVATDIFGNKPAAIEDVRAKTEVVPITEGVWLIRFPIVNVVLVETQVGLVLVDSGYAAASDALLETIRELSDKPLHTVIYTHGHVDHAYGLKSLLAAGERPEIIAHENLPKRFKRYIRTRGSLAKYMGQPLASLPAQDSDLVYPTRLMDERLEILVGGERFVIQHHPAETDDQVYVWVPGRSVLASADYYQGFLPNAGNGKRVQRYPEEWATAMREMASLKPTHLAPAHGKAITNNPDKIQSEFILLADALESIVEQTIALLNRGTRKDLVPANVKLPANLRKQHSLREQYVSVQDISKMVILRYTGWWDDIPSHWSPASLKSQARELASLAGGVEVLTQRARALMRQDLRLASHLVDWAWLADPSHPEVQQAVLDVYKKRVLDKSTNTMEMVNYIAVMARARAYQNR